jgi:hypothetical protein
MDQPTTCKECGSQNVETGWAIGYSPLRFIPSASPLEDCRRGRNKKRRGPSEDHGATPHKTRLIRQLHPMLFPQL